MFKHTLFLFFVAFFVQINWLESQILTNSNLPILIINTNGQEIPDNPKIDASMGIIYNGEGFVNSIGDAFNHYNSNITIEKRGNASQTFDKKSYSFETKDINFDDSSASLFSMGKDEDWILLAMVIDKTQLRMPFSFYLSQHMGHYAPEWEFVELVINNEYKGLYLLTEKIKRDDDRVDIAKLTSEDISGLDVTGGYILKIDWLDDPEGFESNFDSQGGNKMFYQWNYPKASKIKPEQAEYIQGFINDFEEAVFSANYSNLNGLHYTDYINVNSFMDFILINELSKNSDGYKLSSYLHKDRDDNDPRLIAGPIWDFDQTYGISMVCSCDDYTGWTYLQNQPNCEDLESMPMWWQQMMLDTVFTDSLKCRWKNFREGILHNDSISHWIDTQQEYISEAIVRNYTQWENIIGEQIWAQPDPIPESYDEEITYFKAWINNRLNWMDINLPGNCGNNTFSSEFKKETMGNSVFPNPAFDNITVQGKPGEQIVITNYLGQQLGNYSLNNEFININVSNYVPGIYNVLTINEGFVSKQKFIVE